MLMQSMKLSGHQLNKMNHPWNKYKSPSPYDHVASTRNHLDIPRLKNREDDVKFIDKALVRRGYAYYIHQVGHESFIGSVARNLRDIECFADISGLSRGLIYRSGSLICSYPPKLLHILMHVLQIRSIIDLRGFMPREMHSVDVYESLTWYTIASVYQMFVFDSLTQKWLPDTRNRPKDTTEFSCGLEEHHRDMAASDTFHPSQPGYRLFSFPTQSSGLEKSNRVVDMEWPLCVTRTLPFQFNWFESFSEKILDRFPLVSHWINAFQSQREQREDIPTEHYSLRLLISGSVFIYTILETLTWAQLPLLICSSYGKDRVGIISFLILSILGASHEAILTDYCASEAGLASFYLQKEGMSQDGHNRMKGRDSTSCRPNIIRRILRFIQLRWGSVDGYLDWIHFNEKLRDKLRSRLLLGSHSTKVLYKTPAATPFWTGNPSILIPAKCVVNTPPVQFLMTSESMGKILRVVSLFKLRQTFDAIAKEKAPNLWAKAKRRLLTMKKKYKRKTLQLQSGQESVKDSCAASSWGGQIVFQPNNVSRETFSKVHSKRRCRKLYKKIKRLRRGMKEILLAQRVVLHKLTNEMLGLTRVEIVKLILFRNTQLYAQNNEKLQGAAGPDLFDIYLDQPNLFTNKRIVNVGDVSWVIKNHFRVHHKLNGFKSSRYRHRSSMDSTGGLSDSSGESPCPRVHQKRLKTFSRECKEPKYFFHELCQESQNLHHRGPMRASSVSCRTFREWLMRHWILPGETVVKSNPFQDTRDECFVSPDILAQYFRYQHSLGRCSIPLSHDKIPRGDTSLPTQGYCMEQNNESFPSLRKKKHSGPMEEAKFYGYLKRHIHSQVEQFRQINKAKRVRKKKEGNSLTRMMKKDAEERKRPDPPSILNPLLGREQHVLSTPQGPKTFFDLPRGSDASRLLGSSVDRKTPWSKNESSQIAKERSCPRMLLKHDTHRLCSAQGQEALRQTEWTDESCSNECLKDSLCSNRDMFAGDRLGPRHPRSRGTTKSFSDPVLSFQPIEDACDFNTDDERDFLFQQILQEEPISAALDKCQEEFMKAARNRGSIDPICTNMKLPIQLSTPSNIESSFVNLSYNAFGSSVSSYDKLIRNDGLYMASEFTRDMNEGAIYDDMSRLELSSKRTFL